MLNLPKYTLSHDQKKDDWALREDSSGRIKRRFDSKAEATAGGVLRRTVGPSGGSSEDPEDGWHVPRGAHISEEQGSEAFAGLSFLLGCGLRGFNSADNEAAKGPPQCHARAGS
jgi:hypothetical protein